MGTLSTLENGNTLKSNREIRKKGGLTSLVMNMLMDIKFETSNRQLEKWDLRYGGVKDRSRDGRLIWRQIIVDSLEVDKIFKKNRTGEDGQQESPGGHSWLVGVN